MLIEGINTTEGTGGAGFYFDYSSLEEVFLGTVGPDRPRCRTPACRASSSPSRAATSSPASTTSIGTTTRCRARTFPSRTRCRRRSTTRRSASTATRSIATTTRRSTSADRSRRTRSGGSAPTARSSTRSQQPNFQFDKTFDTKLWNAVGKGTYQVNQKHKIVGYYQWGQKIQPNRLPQATYTYLDEGPTNRQDSGSWVYKAEWNGTLSDKLYRRGPLRRLRLLLPADHQRHRAVLLPRLGHAGDHRLAPEEPERSRSQAVELSPATYFLDSSQGQPHVQDGRARC